MENKFLKYYNSRGINVKHLIEILNHFDKDIVICLKEDLFVDFLEDPKFRYSEISNIEENEGHFINSFGNEEFGKFLTIY